MDGIIPTQQTLGRYLRQVRQGDELEIRDVVHLLRMLGLVGLNRTWSSSARLPGYLEEIEAGTTSPTPRQLLSLKLVLTINVGTARGLVREGTPE